MHLTIKGLAKQTSIYGLFQLLQKALSIAVIPLYTHYLPPDQLGSLDILYLIVWIIGTVGGSKLDAAFVRFYPDAVRSGSLHQLLSSSVAGLLVVASGFCFIGVVAAKPILSFMFSTKDVPVTGFYLALAATWLELVGSLPLAYLRTQHEAKLVGSISLIQSLAGTLTGLFCVVVLHTNYVGLVIGLVVSGLTLVILSFSAMLRRTRLYLDFHYVERLFKYSLPMLAAPLFMYLLNYENRYFLLRFRSLEDVGIYSMAYKFAMLSYMFVVSPFGEMWGPNQFLLYEAGQKETYQKLTLLYISLVYFVALSVNYFSYEATFLFIDRSYYRLLTIVAPLTVGVAVWGVVPTLDLGFQIRNKTWLRSFTTGVAAIANAVFNWLLIPVLGMMGAALATLASFTLLAAVTHFFNAPLTDYSVHIRKTVLLSIILFVASCVTYLSPYLPYALFLPIRVVSLVAFGIACLTMNDIRAADIVPTLRSVVLRR